MRTALTDCATTVDAVCAAPMAGLTGADLKWAAISTQRLIDQLTVVQSRLLTEIESSGVWRGTGARSAADWLAGKTNSSYGTAKKKERLGSALKKSPKLADAVGNGDLSPDTAGELAGAVSDPPEGADPDELVDACKGTSPREARDAVERWKELNTPETDEEAEARRFARRSLRSTAPVDGQITVTATMPVLQARSVLKVCSYLGGKPDEHDTRTTEQRMCDGLMLLADAFAKGEVRGGREKPTLLITIPADSLAGRSNEPGVTDFGDRIPAHVVRMLAENAHLQRVLTAGSHILDLGRQVRYATHEQYKALLARDGGCRQPGCHIPAAWCEADHLIPHEDGGTTDLDNLVLWCSHHHHVKHLPGTRVHGNAHDLWIELPDGTTTHCPPRQRTTKAAA